MIFKENFELYSLDLFSQAIQSSGSALTEWSFSDRVVDVTKKLVNDLNCPTHSSLATKICLKQALVEDIHDAADRQNITRNALNFVWYQPRLDGDFFSKDLVELIQEAPKKPLMIGFMKMESLCSGMEFRISIIPKNTQPTQLGVEVVV